MKGTVVSLRLNPELLERLNKATENRNAYIVEAIEDKLNGVKLHS